MRLSLVPSVLSLWRTPMNTIYCHSLTSGCQGLGIIKPIWTEVQVLCKSKECSVPTNMESTKAVTLVMFKVKGTVGGLNFALNHYNQYHRKDNAEATPMFSGDYEKKTSWSCCDKQTSPSPPAHPLPAERCATAVSAQPPLLHMWKVYSVLLNSCFRWYLRKDTEFWKQHVRAHSRAGESCTGSAGSRGSKFISVCRGGAKSFFVLTGSCTQSLSTKAAVPAAALVGKGS